MKEGENMEDVLSACMVTMNIPVAWGEMDAMGHVNNIIYFRYFETVRIEYFNRLGMMDYQRESGIGPILASTEYRYKLPLHAIPGYGDCRHKNTEYGGRSVCHGL